MTLRGEEVRSRRVHGLLLAASCVALAAPLLAVRHPPFTDLPEHVAAIASLARLMGGDGGEPYALALGSSQYLAYHVAGALLTCVVRDAVLANQLLLAGVAVGWVLAFRVFLASAGRDPRLALLAAPLFYGRALVIGFLPYLASVPVVLLALAALVRLDRAPTFRRGAAFGALGLLLFYVHVSTFGLLVLAGGGFVAVRALEPAGRPVDRARRLVRRGVTRLAWLAPSAVAALVWVRAGSLAHGRALPTDRDVVRIPVERALHAVPFWALDAWPSHGDEIAAVLFWSAFAAVVALARGEVPPTPEGEDGDRPSTLALAAPAIAATALALLTPWAVGPATLLNVRLAPLVVLFVLAPLPFHRVRHAGVPLVLGTLATFVAAGTTWREARSIARDEVGDLDALLREVPAGARVANLPFGEVSTRSYFPPYLYPGAFHRAARRGVSSWGFAELPHWPLHFRADVPRPPKHGRFWVFRPCAYRYREDGAYYDVVLARDRPDLFDGAPGPRFEVLGRSGRYVAYRKVVGGEVETEGRDGPCE